MMDHQINDKDGQCNGNTADSLKQEGLESTITNGHVLDHVQCQPQRVTMATRTPSSLPMKPQLDASNTYVTDSTNTTIPSSSSIGTVDYQNQHGSSYFANALTTLQMQHALKLAVNANSQQQQNFSEGFPNSSSQASMYNGVRSANTLSPPPLNNHLNQFSSSGPSLSATMTVPTGLPTTPIVTSSPSSSLASAARLASMGVAFGRGVNPNIPNSQAALNGGNGGSTGTGNANSLSNGGMGKVNQNNPPIVNTGNNGPMCVQPGDWVCLQCGFVNWRRRKICMRCYPLLDQSNELSRSIMNGANLAAQIAAGIEPSPELLASLTTTNAKKTSNIQSTSTSNSSSQSPAYHSQQPYSSNLNYANNDLISSTPSPLQPVSSSSVLRTYQQNGYKQYQDETVDNSLAWSLQNGLNMSDTQQAATTTNMHNYASSNRMFSSNRPSPMHTPLPSSTFDHNSSFNNLPPIAKPSHSIRQSQSFSMLSSLNGFTSCSAGNAASPYTSNSKSAFATPKEEKQFSKAQELWFGNKRPSEASVPLANGGDLSSAKTAMVWNTVNNQEEKGQTFSEFRFPVAKPSISKNDNLKGLNDQIENNFSFATTYKQDSNEPSYEPVKVSAANESDEIVVPCGSEVSKPLQEYPQQQQLLQKPSFNRLLPIGKAAIEPPSSSSSSSSSSILTTKPRSTTCSSSSSTSSSTLKPAAATSLTQASSFDQQHQNYQV